MRPTKHILTVPLLLLSTTYLVAEATGNTPGDIDWINWTGAQNNSWRHRFNWNRRNIPNRNDENARIEIGEDPTITITGDRLNTARLWVRGSTDVTLNMNAGLTYKLHKNDGQPSLLVEAGSKLTLTGGKLFDTKGVVIGNDGQGASSLTVRLRTGMTNREPVVIGKNARGFLNLKKLPNRPKPKINSLSTVVVAENTGADGSKVTVEKADWKLSKTLTIGNEAKGEVSIIAKGMCDAKNIDVAANAGGGDSHLKVDGESMLKVRRQMTVGVKGKGQLSITGKATGKVKRFVVAADQGADDSTARIDGAQSSLTVTKQLTVGQGAKGVLLITNGAKCTVNGNNVQTSVVIAASDDADGSRLVVNDSTLTSTNKKVAVGAKGALEGKNGTIEAKVVNAGTVRPGGSDATGTLTVKGSYEQKNGGMLEIDLSRNGHDVLKVQGAAKLNGKLVLKVVNPPPAVNQQFVILDATSIEDRFGNRADGATWVEAGIRWKISYLPAQGPKKKVQLKVGRLADVNCDGAVNLADLLAVLRAWFFGDCADGCAEDANGDGRIDFEDLMAVLDEWD